MRYGIEVQVKTDDGYEWRRARKSDGDLYEYSTHEEAHRMARFWNVSIMAGLDPDVRVVEIPDEVGSDDTDVGDSNH